MCAWLDSYFSSGIHGVASDGVGLESQPVIDFGDGLTAVSNPISGTVTVTADASEAAVDGSLFAALRTAAGTATPGRKLWLKGRSTDGDGGQGTFTVLDGGPFTDDGGTIAVPGGGTGSRAAVRDYAGTLHAEWYGVRADGATDDTAAMNRAIAAVNAFEGQVRLTLPRGAMVISTALDPIAKARSHIEGQGPFATQINFTATTGSCFTFSLPGATPGELSQCSISGIGFNAAGNTTGQKAAIEFVVCSGFIVQDVWVLNWASDALVDPSIGIWSRGHETVSFRNCVIYADRPIFLDKNPTDPNIDADSYCLENVSLVANFANGVEAAHPEESSIVIGDGVNVDNFTVTGQANWLGGTHGLYLEDTGGVASGRTFQGWHISNVRREQPSAATAGYCIYVKLQGRYMYSGLFANVAAGTDPSNGFYFRNCQYVTLLNCLYGGVSGIALNANGTLDGAGAASNGCVSLSYQNCFFQGGSTLSLSNMIQVRSDDQQPYGILLPASAVWESTHVVSGSRKCLFDSLQVTNGITGDVTGNVAATSLTATSLALGATPATSGALRFTNNEGAHWKDASGNSFQGVYFANDNKMYVGDGTRTHLVIVRPKSGGGLAIVDAAGDDASAAQSGALRFRNAFAAKWRNFGGTADVSGLFVHTDDALYLGDGTNNPSIYYRAATDFQFQWGTTTKIKFGDTYIALGTAPASAGTIRLPNNSSIKGRNSGGSGDVDIVSYEADNKIYIGDGSANTAKIILRPNAGAGVALVDAASDDAGAAQSGILRLRNGYAISARNNAGSGDLDLISSDTADRVIVGFNGGACRVYGGTQLRVDANTTGLGFYGATPIAKPSITGALSTVADAPAKAVMTSIIAALVNLGLATDGTT